MDVLPREQLLLMKVLPVCSGRLFNGRIFYGKPVSTFPEDAPGML